MIDARELRIGNYFLGDEKVRQVTGIGYVPDDVSYQVMFYNGTEEDWTYDYEPIYLTKEWLNKFGISILKRKVPSWCDFFYIYFLGKPEEVEVDDNGIPLSPNLKYVHQLQNLFFALTGTELEIKIPTNP